MTAVSHATETGTQGAARSRTYNAGLADAILAALDRTDRLLALMESRTTETATQDSTTNE